MSQLKSNKYVWIILDKHLFTTIFDIFFFRKFEVFCAMDDGAIVVAYGRAREFNAIAFFVWREFCLFQW